MALGRWGYRIRQLGKALRDANGTVPTQFVAFYLDAEGQTLFYAMSRRDQVHSARTAALLAARAGSGRDLIVSALLHDTGKGRQHIWERVLYVILAGCGAGLLKRLARPGDGARGALYRSLQHPALGAQLAGKAGYQAEVCRLIADHHQPAGEPSVRALQWADELA